MQVTTGNGVVRASSMATRKAEDIEQDEGAADVVEVALEGEQPEPPPVPEKKRRGRKPGSKMAKKEPVERAAASDIEITDQTLIMVGELTLAARRNGMAPGDYVKHVRSLCDAWDLVEKAIP